MEVVGVVRVVEVLVVVVGTGIDVEVDVEVEEGFVISREGNGFVVGVGLGNEDESS